MKLVMCVPIGLSLGVASPPTLPQQHIDVSELKQLVAKPFSSYSPQGNVIVEQANKIIFGS